MDQLLEFMDKTLQTKKYRRLEQINPQRLSVILNESAYGIGTIFDKAVTKIPFTPKSLPTVDSFSYCSSADATAMFLENFCLRNKANETIELLDVQAVHSSKSNLSSYHSIESFGEEMYNLFRNNEYNENLNENEYFFKCIHEGISEGGTDFIINEWAPALTWSNNGGSHRFATACYLAKSLKRSYQIAATLTTFSINVGWIRDIQGLFDTYVMSVEDGHILTLYDVLNINDSSHVLIYLNDAERELSMLSGRDQGKTIILMIRKGTSLPSIAKRWLNKITKNNGIPSLLELVG